MKQINNIHNDAVISGEISPYEIEFILNQSLISGNNQVLNVQKINDPPPGPHPSCEINYSFHANRNDERRVFPDRGPGRFFRKARSTGCRLFRSFSEKIRDVWKRSVTLYIYPLKTPGALTGSL
ncbi:MAG: hypothetical protein AB2L26_10825 [Ignavibacteria bacterium]